MKQYSKYTKSAIGWLDSFPSHWNVTYLKRFSDRITDGAHFSPPTVFEGRNYVSVKDIDEFGNIDLENCKKIDQNEFDNLVKNGCQPTVGDLLLTKDGTIGRAAVVNNNDFVVLSSLGIISPNEKLLLSYYLRYYLISKINYEQMMSLIAGAALTRLTIEKIKHLFITIPPYDEQTHIVRYLDHQCTIIDDLINKKEQLIERLQELRQATINEAVTKGLDPKAEMKDSGVVWLGEYPKSWNLTQLRHLISKAGSGVTPRGGAEVYTDEGVIFIRSQNVHFDGLGLDDVVRIDPETHSNMSGSKVFQKDVLLNITGASIGRCCVVTIDEEMNVNQHVCILRSNGKILPDYLNLVLQSNIGQLQVKNGATGGNREGLTLEALKEFIIPVPEVTIQADLVSKIISTINEIVTLVKMNIQQIDNLKEYRQSLISEAVTGKIDVREWQPSYEN